MSHVDEGILHAYLDDALDAVLSAGDAAWVREHVAMCAECAARLEEERAARNEASALLGLVAAPPGDPPSFEDVRAMAAARGEGRRASRRVWQLGWAASLALALGTGWFLRGVSLPVSVAGSRQERAPSGSAPTPTSDAAEVRAVVPRAASTVPTPAPEAPAVEERAGAPADAGAAGGGVAAGARIDMPDFPGSLPEAKAAVAERRGQAADVSPPAPSERFAAEFRRDSATALFDRRRDSAPPTVLDAPAAFAPRSVGRVTELAVPASDASRLAVPGLVILSVTDLTGDRLTGGVRVLQLVAPGDTLELVHLPGSAQPPALPPVKEGLAELVLRRGEGWLVVRGTGSTDRLRALVSRLDGGR